MTTINLPPFHMAVLDCDSPVPTVYAQRGLYSDVFEGLLRDAQKSVADFQDLNLEFSKYDCVHGQLPSEEDVERIDAVIITGSSFSAYDKEPWISALAYFTRDLYTTHPTIKIFGSCFGHQLLCHALFSTLTHPVVERDPAGWELGVHPITLTPAFLSHFGPVTSNISSPTQLRLQFVHADHVVMPTLPAGFHSIGSSEHCVLQGVWQEDRVLTFQGHAEFDRFINGETVKVFGDLVWEEGFMKRALEMVDRDDDSTWAAGVMLRFFLESVREENIGYGGGEEVMARL